LKQSSGRDWKDVNVEGSMRRDVDSVIECSSSYVHTLHRRHVTITDVVLVGGLCSLEQHTRTDFLGIVPRTVWACRNVCLVVVR
jgi:hypothetical protein